MEMRTGGGTMFSVSDLIGVGGDEVFFSLTHRLGGKILAPTSRKTYDDLCIVSNSVSTCKLVFSFGTNIIASYVERLYMTIFL
jgi:hypothetical protein